MKTDIEIAQEVQMKNINDIAKLAKIDSKYIEQYGNYKAKVDLSLLKENKNKEGKLVLVTTAKADVRTSWRNDINHVDFVDDFIFIEFIGNRVDVTLKEPGDEYLKTEKDRLQSVSAIGDFVKMYLNQGKTIIVLLSPISSRY